MMPQPEEENTEEQPETVTPETLETEAVGEDLSQTLAEEKAKAAEYLAGWQRAQADFINYKRRCEQEKEDIIKYGNTEFILKILPVMDDFERAFKNPPSGKVSHGWLEGMKALERKFRSFLEGEGLAKIEALGKPFDPNLHEAVMQVEGDEGIIVKEFEKGYKLKDRVIRHSKVAVGSGRHESEKEE